jgi:prepilin-type N-terminal cleavage/methylation domain-containing protein
VRGFTLIELVAVVVIAGALIAIAIPAWQSVRWDGRKAALDAVRSAMRANMLAARAAYLVQGLGPGSTVQVNGQAIEVYGEGASVFGYPVPAGSPTPLGMYAMLGCGTDTPATGATVACAAPVGHLVQRTSGILTIWPSATGTIAATRCYAQYSGAYASYPLWASSDGDTDGIGTSGSYTRPSDPDPVRAAGAC